MPSMGPGISRCAISKTILWPSIFRGWRFPAWRLGMQLDYLLKANVYESHPQSGSATRRIPSKRRPATSRAISLPNCSVSMGHFAEWATVVGDRMYVTMAGTFEVVEWKIQPNASDPSEKLVPLRVFEDWFAAGWYCGWSAQTPSLREELFVANQLGETVSVIDHRHRQQRRDRGRRS